nr:hypothetical protein [Leptospira interrogans]
MNPKLPACGTAFLAPVNKLHERKVIQYFVLSYNLERDPPNDPWRVRRFSLKECSAEFQYASLIAFVLNTIEFT